MDSIKRGVAALILLAWVFATMAVFARYLSAEFSLFTQIYLRIGIALLMSVILFAPRLRRSAIAALNCKDIGVLVVRSIFLYAGVVLFTESILHAKIGNASLISTLPLMPILGYVLLKETIKRNTVVYIFVGFIGSLLIVFKDLTIASIGYGEIMALLSLLAFDFSYVTRKWQSETLNNFETTTIMFAIGTLLLCLSAFIAGEPTPTLQNFSPYIITVLLLSALFNVVNLYLTNYGFQHVKAAVAGNILVLEVVFALLYGFLLFNEMPTLRESIGGLLIVASICLVNKNETA